MSFTYEYPRAAITVDIIVISRDKKNILLIERLNEPFKDSWALPGGFLDMDELLVDAAIRELKEETGLENINLQQFQTVDALDRDPRHRTISVIFHGINKKSDDPIAGDDAKSVQWWPINDLPNLAFDHLDIIQRFIVAENLMNE